MRDSVARVADRDALCPNFTVPSSTTVGSGFELNAPTIAEMEHAESPKHLIRTTGWLLK